MTQLSSPSGEQTTSSRDGEDVTPNAEKAPRSPSEEGESRSDAGGDATTQEAKTDADADAAPPLPNEPTPEGPPLPNEPVPPPQDDGWDCQWDPNTQAWFFYNRFSGKTQWDNPRVPVASATTVDATASGAVVAAGEPAPPATEKPPAGGYNPAIHGDYDPNAWYAQGNNDGEDEGGEYDVAAGALDDPYVSAARFNRFTGQFQGEDAGPGRHSDEAKSRRQMNAYFDVDAAANSHDGRSLKAERSHKKPSKTELKAFKEKRRARKEEKRRAWLRD